MKTLLIGFNVSENVFPLALSYLKEYSGRQDIIIKEFCISQRSNRSVNKTIELQAVSYILMCNPDVVGFSGYIWNISIIQDVCKLLKKINPKIILVVGGVEVEPSSLTEDIDFVVQREGELSFKLLLDAIEKKGSYQEIPNLVYRREGKIYENPISLIENLDDLPWPYRNSQQKKFDVVRIETSRGCPFKCKYCYYANSVKTRTFSLEYLEENINYLFDNFTFKFLTIVDANLNVNKTRMKKILDIIAAKSSTVIVGFELKPELIDEELIEILDSYKFLITAELGLQSIDASVMAKCSRFYDLERVKKGMALLSRSKVRYKIDLMYGLPGDNFFKFLNSARFLLKHASRQNQLPAHHFMLLNNTEYGSELDRLSRMQEKNSSMVFVSSTQNIVDLFKTKLFVDMLNIELKLR